MQLHQGQLPRSLSSAVGVPAPALLPATQESVGRSFELVFWSGL